MKNATKLKKELTETSYLKELDSNNDNLIGKDLVDNHGQVGEGLQEWRSIYKSFL